MGTNGRCQQVSPLCRTFSPVNGSCLTCFAGYVISGSACIVGTASNSDSNCETTANGVCQKCYSGFYVNSNGICTQFNTLCRTSNSSNGACLSCYPGYTLNNGLCVINSSPTASKDPNCKASDPSGVCNSCYEGNYLSVDKACIKMDPLCRNYTSSLSECSACYEGYVLNNGKCLLPADLPAQNTDTYCIKSQGAACLACANGYFLPPNGTCTQVNPLCRASDMNTGFCTQCYTGFVLSGPTCVQGGAASIPFCANVTGNICSTCINGYYVSNGGCAAVNMLCGTYKQSDGSCLTCIPGYVLQSGNCILPSLGIDPNCLQYLNSYCSSCATGYSLINFWCTPIDPNCAQYDYVNNLCLSCAQLKTPQGANCV